jgi:S1-C subfamily serine protease
MTTPPRRRSRRRGRRAALSIALVACLAPGAAHADAGTAVTQDTSVPGPIGGQSPLSPTAGGVGVVNVVSRLDNHGMEALGTGIVLGTSGEVLTNNHVIRGARQIRVNLPGRPAHRAIVLGADPTHDVALLAVRGPWQPTPAALGDSAAVAVGDPVAAIGNAGGVGMPSIATGFVTGLDRALTASSDDGSHPEQLQGMIEIDADIQPGDSGGPLMNAAGQVVGMDTAASTGPGPTGSPQGYAIPIDAAMGIVQGFQSAPPVALPASWQRHPHRPRRRSGGGGTSLSRGARGSG